MGRFFVLAAGMVSLAAMGATVTVNPGNGVVTNVQEVFSGDTALLLNSGTTGGGIVSLNEANTHTGGTTVKSGIKSSSVSGTKMT